MTALERKGKRMPRRRTSSSPPLAGRVAVVAGATRGAGRGIARALGEAGAIVYCTGRSVRGTPSAYGRPETIDETAEMIVAAGGTATAVQVDHAVEAEVEALFARVDREQGRLTRDRRGLIVEVTENDVLSAGGNPLAQTVKFALKGFALSMAAELQPHRVAAIAITPGYLRSESMLQRFGVTEANWRDRGKKDTNFLESETPLFVGRAVAALAADPGIMKRTGQLFSSWEVAREFKLTDEDGRRPDWGRPHHRFLPPSSGASRSTARRL